MEQITLYYRQGSSDKIYQVQIEPRGNKYSVNYAFGRRGTTLQAGSKTPTAVDYGAAKAIYDKLVQDKIAKGYSTGEDGTPYQQIDKEPDSTGILPQLLNPIGEEDLHRFINDPAFAMQEKFDGRRTLIQKNGAITGINRKGLTMSLPVPVVKEVEQIPNDCILDGESIGDVFWVFDVLSLNGEDARSWPYEDRLMQLAHMISGEFGFIKLAETAIDPNDKRNLLEQLRKEHREGVVFKKLDAPYVPGRPASGGDQFKLKFYATASFIVMRINAKRSVTLMLLNGEKIVNAGNVTIPANHNVPEVGKVVEVRYLYAFPESGCVFQPVYLGIRDDVGHEECTVGQLKWKANTDTVAA